MVSFQLINQMKADLDKDGSGAIDYEEFEYMMTTKIGERDSKEVLMKAIHIINHDQNVKFFTLYIIFTLLFSLLVVNLGKDICIRHQVHCERARSKFH